MRKIKFKYIIERHNGHIFQRIFTLAEIEDGCVKTFFEQNIIGAGDKVNRCQFIDLYDASPEKKEIYKGDICRIKGGTSLFVGGKRQVIGEWEHTCEIKYSQNSCRWVGQVIGNIKSLNLLDWYEYEVIGNIHDNGDLLK